MTCSAESPDVGSGDGCTEKESPWDVARRDDSPWSFGAVTCTLPVGGIDILPRCSRYRLMGRLLQCLQRCSLNTFSALSGDKVRGAEGEALCR